MARERKLPRPDDADIGVDFPEEEDMDESDNPAVVPPADPNAPPVAPPEPAAPEEEEDKPAEEEEDKEEEV